MRHVAALTNAFKVVYIRLCMLTMHAFLFSVYHMKETGWVKISQDDTMKLHYQYQEEKMAKK